MELNLKNSKRNLSSKQLLLNTEPEYEIQVNIWVTESHVTQCHQITLLRLWNFHRGELHMLLTVNNCRVDSGLG